MGTLGRARIRPPPPRTGGSVVVFVVVVLVAAALLALDETSFAERFAGSPLRRAGRAGLLRNVCVSLGNERDGAAVPALAGALVDPSPLVRAHAAWALGRCKERSAREALARRLPNESDTSVRSEIESALAAG